MKCAEDLRSLRVRPNSDPVRQRNSFQLLILLRRRLTAKREIHWLVRGTASRSAEQCLLPHPHLLTPSPPPPPPPPPPTPPPGPQLMATKHETSYKEVKVERDRVKQQRELDLATAEEQYAELQTECKEAERKLLRETVGEWQ